MNFSDIEYLRVGTDKQQRAAVVLDELDLLRHLKSYDPILVGTIPIGIDLPESDLDIICYVVDFSEFKQCMLQYYEKRIPGLAINHRTVAGVERMVFHFQFGGWAFEVFGQPIPTTQQNGYRHMVIEHRVLRLLGESVRQAILKLKREGSKTEPAFSKILGLTGDPYEAVLGVDDWTDEQIQSSFQRYGYLPE
ncbi:DUF4269 domain-containing protein [Paenibacillus sp. JCM 10914]|uniref:DUF4269 domain-containing protein n=1 Tax=Paenibacillus sp. JCM 10914 TaxID=1236974 RepID=UPI0003CC8FFB|nr:DUF4269 domain-containing protein [Paenibacillus sp. JCM 10914]GAE04962.1 hypothetical protein JCM10914_1039 [Paenibacillus sp. JCM 10914]